MAWPSRLLSFLPSWRASRQARCFSALSQQPSLEQAVAELALQLKQAGQRQSADLALVFCSSAYASDLQRVLPLLRDAIASKHWIGCCAGGVVGTDPQGQALELEHQPGISLTLLQLPDTTFELFQIGRAHV